MKIDSLEKVTINGSGQWLLIRGENPNAPLILQVQAGPGFPIIPEASAIEKRLHLEENYLVAYWDQRGCGKSFSKETDPATINFAQLTDDLIYCTKYLLKKFKKEKVILVGYSIGATLSLMAASKDSSLFSHLILAGIDVDIPAANKYVSEFMISKASEIKNQKLLKHAIDLSKLEISNAGKFQERAKLVTNFGGIKMNSSYNQVVFSIIANMLFSKAYRLTDIPKTIKGMDFCQDAFLPEMNTLNLFNQIDRIDVPVHFIQGKHDDITT